MAPITHQIQQTMVTAMVLIRIEGDPYSRPLTANRISMAGSPIDQFQPMQATVGKGERELSTILFCVCHDKTTRVRSQRL